MIRNAVIAFIIFFVGVLLVRERETLLGLKTREAITSFVAKNATHDDATHNDEDQTTTTLTHVVTQHNQKKNLSRRKFVSYTSSKWEQLWLDNVDSWARNQSICQVLMEEQQQVDYIHDFLNISCTARYGETPEYPGSKWCIIDDGVRPLWYDTANRKEFMFIFRVPMHLKNQSIPTALPVQPRPQDEHIVSKFVFLDETTGSEYIEYIEPLVAALRHPLAHCEKFKIRFSLFRGYILPPPTRPLARKYFYFDAGASSWNSGAGGPSLSSFWDMWGRQGIDFDHVYAYELATPRANFTMTVPERQKSKITYQQCAVSSSVTVDTDDQPFLPKLIKRIASKDDYVLFKLDIDSPDVEAGNIDYILQDEDNGIDEVAWEHHVDGNYLMMGQWGDTHTHMSLYDSYQYFLKLRQKGIRAHSWV